MDNINKKDKNTIEFRASNGTLEPDEILNNIRLYGRIMQNAKEVMTIKEKIFKGKMLTETEIRKFRAFRRLCTQDLSEDERRNGIYRVFV